MDTRLRGATGCPLADFDVLSQIADAGGRLRMTELAERVLVSRSGLTRCVASLEDEGLVKRAAVGEDGRGVTVYLTDAGVRRPVETQRSHPHDVTDLVIARLNDRELAMIERVMRKVFVDCNFG
jgi:DNA-binding MarR family transcriptional regulator